jgi:maltose O-acetyltransferase
MIPLLRPRFQEGGLTIGRGVAILHDVEIDQSHHWHISIGDEVTLAPGVRIIAHDASTKRHLGYTRIAKIVIEKRVFVGAGSIVLPGVTIGENSIIGAGSVVVHSIPPNVVAAGNPAKVICTLEEFLAKRAAELKTVPVFGAEYTVDGGVTKEMRLAMNEKLGSGFGYVE